MSAHSLAQRLQPVRRIAGDQEDAAAQRFADCQRQLAASEQQLQELERYLEEMDASGSAMTPAMLANREAFTRRLVDALRYQAGAVRDAHARLDAAREAWLRRRSDARVLDHLIERSEAEERQHQERRVQALMDEFSQMRAAHRGDPT